MAPESVNSVVLETTLSNFRLLVRGKVRDVYDLGDRLAAAPGPVEKPSLFIGKFVSGDYFNRVPVVCELAGSRRNDKTMTVIIVATPHKIEGVSPALAAV